MRTLFVIIFFELLLTSCASLEKSVISRDATQNQNWRNLDQGRFEAGSRFK